jgi:hypothetical protein
VAATANAIVLAGAFGRPSEEYRLSATGNWVRPR